MTKGTTIRMVIMLAIASVILGLLVVFQGFRNKMIAKSIRGQSNPPQTVSTMVAKTSSWQPTMEALGTFSASKQADLSPEVSGVVTAIHFDSGQQVHAGESLVELNSEPVQAQVAQLKAQAGLAKANLKRDEAQLKVQAVSQAVVDTDRATLKSLQAQVKAQQALLAQRTIKAPFSGRLGIRRVNLGQYLAPGKAVVTIQRLDPMEVDFNVPQSQINMIKIGGKVKIKTSLAPGKMFEGAVTAIEPQVDTKTRNLTVRARVPNPAGILLPGAFATVHIERGETHEYVTLPNAAVAYNPYGATVFVVKKGQASKAGAKPQLTVEQRFVTTGPTRGDQVAILKGIKAGETVVTAGQLKLRNGSRILVNNSVQPSDNPNPHVSDE
ncbi:MAG: efflux RND transporter periplasmic adaptor subunit [Gammaproteobacteria bacterium]|jgi:membrane fusion protein, multidrug efflux system